MSDDKERPGPALLRAVDMLYREKAVPKETIFANIEKAIRLAIQKYYDDEEDIDVVIDRQSGEIHARKGETTLDPHDLGRIAAGAAKQFIIQGIKEEESNSVFQVYAAQKGDLVTGIVHRFDGGGATVALGKAEAFLPRGEMIPGETVHAGERVKAVILDVRKQGHRVKIILSRTHPDFVKRLFEQEIPEIQEQTITIKAVAREAGYRTKVAISSIDMKVDCVGACVGVRGSRIKNITEELGGERIDIVRWNDAKQVLIPNALQPANIEEVFIYDRLGRAIVLVNDDQLSLAIGRRGQNVRLASKLVGMDIEIMTHDELNEGIERAEGWFRELPGVTDEIVEAFITEGFLSYDDLYLSIETGELAEMTGLSEDDAEEILIVAEERAQEMESEPRAGKGKGGESTRTSVVPARPSPQAQAVKLLGEATPEPTPAKLTAEMVLGPMEARPQEPALDAARILGDLPAPQPQPEPVPTPVPEE